MVNADSSGNSNEMGAFSAQKNEPNGSLDSPLCPKTSENTSRVYKLMIQIEKIRPKPCPKSKKLMFQSRTETQQGVTSTEICNVDDNSESQRKVSLCLICNENFQSAQSLYLHKKKHHRFVCQICDAYCATRSLCDRHEKLHLSEDPKLPHKCHLCSQKFESKRNVRLHTRVMHSFLRPTVPKATNTMIKENPLRSKASYVKYIDRTNEANLDTDYKGKMTVKEKRNDGKILINDGAVTFTCHVCCQDFSTVEAAEAHTRGHTELAEKEHKCNICTKVFKTEMILNAHLAQHLSRALRCPVCPKAFINRTTLRIHMKSHDREKR